MDSDKTITATFTRIQYTLTLNTSGNGNISINPSGGIYDAGTTVTITANPDAGWQFAGWSGDLSGNTNPATITMDSDKTVTATFTRIQHTLTANIHGNGNVSLNPAGGTYNEGDTVTLTATPDAGWQFAGWSGDLSGNTNPATITMDSDKTVTATFAQSAQTYVPDDNFEAYLEANGMGNGVANDDYVSTANIENVPSLNINNQNIADLTGIQDFAALTSLRAWNNQLTNVDLSQNSQLVSVAINGNDITSVNLQNLSLLESADLGYNNLTAVDLSSNTALRTLSISQNQLTDLDLSGLTDLVSLDCSGNALTYLNVQNGNNTNFVRFNATGNPNLTCIFVDDAAWSTSNWTNIDANSHFVETQADCDAVSITDETLKQIVKVYPNPVKDQLIIELFADKKMEISVYNLVGQELIKQSSSNGQLSIDLTKLPAANYLIKIKVENHQVFYNVIKE
jgi:uncharacterized repeat protein (TIGR02543 family)